MSKDFKYLSQKPGVQLVKSGTHEKKELDKITGISNLKSQVVDVPVTSTNNALQLGFFSMQPSVDFEFTYEYLELKAVINGKIIVHDDQGEKYTAEVGDVLIFTPKTTVVFDSESDGNAVIAAHRLPDPSFI